MTINSKIKTIFFDWGGTLHDPQGDVLFPGVPELLRKLAERYTLVLISLAKSAAPDARREKIKNSGIESYFKLILVGADDKDEMYEQALKDLAVSPEEVAVIDDRTIRGIAWGNRQGAMTIWIKRGKFASEGPTEETGQPVHRIDAVTEVAGILL